MLAGDPAIERRVSRSPRLLRAVVVLGELYYGAYKSARQDENLGRINDLISRGVMLAPDARTAAEFGTIKNELRLKGRPIPDADMWLAAAARQWGMTVLSRDQHFGDVDGLSWETW